VNLGNNAWIRPTTAWIGHPPSRAQPGQREGDRDMEKKGEEHRWKEKE